MATLIKIDRNGTKYWREQRCGKCGGTGIIQWSNLDGGRCWQCGGSGICPHDWKEYTPEYAKKLADRRLAKERKEAPSANKKLWASIGLAEDGSAWVCVNKYAKSEDMKPLGARWNPNLGWFFKEERDGTFYMSAEDIGEYMANGHWRYKDFVFDAVEERRTALLPKTESEYMGEEGKPLTVEVVYESKATFETHHTYYGETVYVLRFKCGENTIVWKTQAYKELESGKTYVLSGKVKEHSEYKGDKQTVLTRCKIEKAKGERNEYTSDGAEQHFCGSNQNT